MNWFKKEGPLPKKAPKKRGFLSLPWDEKAAQAKRKREIQEGLATTFQKGIDTIKMLGVSGVAMDGAVAMDNQYSDLTTSKLRNMRVTGLPEGMISWFSQQGFIGYQTAAMISQNWLIDKLCSMPAKDASRNGYEITVNDGSDIKPEILQEIAKQDKIFKIKQNCIEFVHQGRVFGIRIAMFIVESKDKDYYSKPFNIDGVKPDSYKGISQIDPYWVTPLLDNSAAANPAAIDFYEPTWWNIGGVRVHKSHLVIMRTEIVPDILKPTYLFGGIPIPQKVAARVFAAERTADEAPALAMSKRLTIFKTSMSMAEANVEGFEAKMNIWTNFQNNFGVKVCDKEADDITQFDTSLADFDNMIMTQFQLVAAAGNVPATKLLGTSPKGFNATGEFEEASYHEELETMQEHYLSPLVNRHHLLLMRSYIAPKYNIAPFEVDISWLPTDAETAQELAETNLKKAQADKIHSDSGAINGVDIRNRLIVDRQSGYNGLEPIDDPLNDEMEIDEDLN